MKGRRIILWNPRFPVNNQTPYHCPKQRTSYKQFIIHVDKQYINRRHEYFILFRPVIGIFCHNSAAAWCVLFINVRKIKASPHLNGYMGNRHPVWEIVLTLMPDSTSLWFSWHYLIAKDQRISSHNSQQTFQVSNLRVFTCLYSETVFVT